MAIHTNISEHFYLLRRVWGSKENALKWTSASHSWVAAPAAALRVETCYLLRRFPAEWTKLSTFWLWRTREKSIVKNGTLFCSPPPRDVRIAAFLANTPGRSLLVICTVAWFNYIGRELWRRAGPISSPPVQNLIACFSLKTCSASKQGPVLSDVLFFLWAGLL